MAHRRLRRVLPAAALAAALTSPGSAASPRSGAASFASPESEASPRSDAERADRAVTREGRDVRLSWPQGEVTLPADAYHGPSPDGAKDAPTTDAPLKAWTRGDFEIAYILAREAGAVRAKDVAVRVRNRTHLPADPSASLREHEDVHRRINETGAQDLRTAMGAFAVAASTPPVSLREAERRFRAEFRRRVKAVEDLHTAWDANHKVRE